jgi:solute carrier family 35 protein F5
MTLSQQYSSALYWVGACIVLLSFLFINHERHDAGEAAAAAAAVDEAHEHEGTI